MKNGIELIHDERARQIAEEGFTPAHDQVVEDHGHGELARAAACYAMHPYYGTNRCPYSAPLSWPWHTSWWKPCPNDRVRELVKAGALIAAEIDRLQAMELEWTEEYDDEDNEYWEALSIYHGEDSFCYRIRKRLGMYYLDSDHELMRDQDREKKFKTLEDAQAQCKAYHASDLEEVGREYKQRKEG